MTNPIATRTTAIPIATRGVIRPTASGEDLRRLLRAGSSGDTARRTVRCAIRKRELVPALHAAFHVLGVVAAGSEHHGGELAAVPRSAHHIRLARRVEHALVAPGHELVQRDQ